MNASTLLKKTDFMPDKELILFIKKELKTIIGTLNEEIGKQNLGAEVFIGGSFAKGTLVKKEEYDIDIFVRFDWRYERLTEELEKIITKVSKKLHMKIERMHGSRDYFQMKKGQITFEVIPVSKIKNPKEARNVTDLSYFHVNYVKNRINGKLAEQIAIAKSFCKAQGVYGAESYIQGFSGYALECLLIYYKSFEKMLRELSKISDRALIDPAKKYKNEDEALINLNESKLKSPIVLIDPTWKERNVLAALGEETFLKFKEAAKKFLKKPSMEFFMDKKIDLNSLKKEAKMKKMEFLHLKIKTNKQAGDIAGTKMKKFHKFIILELEEYFDILRDEFVYDEKQIADSYLILRSKKEIVKIGPPIKMKDACIAFRKANKNIFEKNGLLHSKIKISFSAKRFLKDWMKKYAKKAREMDITSIKIG